MSDNQTFRLPDWEEEVVLWIEQDSSVMLKARTQSGDPVELTADDARALARALAAAADRLEAQGG